MVLPHEEEQFRAQLIVWVEVLQIVDRVATLLQALRQLHIRQELVVNGTLGRPKKTNT